MSAPLRADASITPTVLSGTEAAAASNEASRSGESLDSGAPGILPELATPSPRIALGSMQKETSLPGDRLVLAQQLQRELARVGCYDGDVNGNWTPPARKAMKTFVERINATLPTEEPDYVLLALVQAAREKVCGAACPPGHGLAEGRCVPNAVLAGRKAAQITRAAAPAQAAPATAAPAGERRMGLAGPAVAKNSEVADGALPAAVVNTPAPLPPAPAATRPADAKRARAQPVPFGPAIFRQMGF